MRTAPAFSNVTGTARLCLAAAGIAVIAASASLVAAPDLTPQQVRSAYVCLPSLGDPPDQLVLFKDGK